MNHSILKMEFGEKSFQILLEKLPAGVYICDAEGRIQYFNQRAVEVWGRTPELNSNAEKFCGSYRLYHPDGKPMRHDQCWMALAIENDMGYNELEVIIERPDGSRLSALAHANPIHTEAGRLLGAINIVIDISERKRAEQALSESERRFREMLDALPAAIYTTDAKGQLTYFNPAAVEFSGHTPEIGTDEWWVSWKLYYPDGAPLPHDECPMANSLREGRAIRKVEAIAERPDGKRIWFEPYPTPLRDGEGRIVGGINMLVDITERKRAEVAIAQLAAIVESSNDAIISKDLNGIITSWNKGAEKLFGYAAEEVVGKPITILFPPDRLDEESRILERIRRNERVEHYETVRRCKDGHEIDISLTVSPIRDRGGKIIGASKIARDISERKRIEAERKEMLYRESAARAEAEAANRSKDEFLTMVSHELRSPLNAILGYNRMLHEGLPDEAQVKEACNIIERNAGTQLRLIEDLLDTARIVSGKLTLEMRKTYVGAVITEAFNMIRPEAEAKGIRMRIADCGLRIAEAGRSQSAFVLGDAVRLQQIVWNLLSNAIKFTPANGQVELCAELVGEHIRIIVSDTGKGIRPEFLPQVFDRFRQSDSSSAQRYGGLGLGLALVKHLAELHGGQVEAASDGEGCGATFTVTLPLATESEPVAAVPPALAASTPLTHGKAWTDAGSQLSGPAIAGVRVLVVDDQEESRALLADFLGRCDAIVMTASSGAEALAILSNSPDGARHDIVLCDISMPEEDGYAVLRRIRSLEAARGIAASQQIPAVALTALAGSEDRLRALNSGFQFHIAKPVDPVELLFVIANVTGIECREPTLN
jgi:PAS domain S-box-containing protein